MSDDIRAGFIRQRRNLIAISLVLLFAQVAGITLEQVNLFGTEFRIANPTAVDIALWIAWFYWLWRYYVYYRDLGDKGFQSAQYERLLTVIAEKANELLRAEIAGKKNIECPKADIKVSCDNRNVGQTQVGTDATIWRIRFTNCVAKCGSVEEPIWDAAAYEVFIRDDQLARYKRKALWRTIVHTRLASEYVLPYIIAAAPPVYLVGATIIEALR